MTTKTTRASRRARRFIRLASQDPAMTVVSLAVLAVLQLNAGRSDTVDDLPDQVLAFEVQILLDNIAKVPAHLHDTTDNAAKQQLFDAFSRLYADAWEGENI